MLELCCFTGVRIGNAVQERRKKEREVEEKRLAAERAAEDERRKAVEVRSSHRHIDFIQINNTHSCFFIFI